MERSAGPPGEAIGDGSSGDLTAYLGVVLDEIDDEVRRLRRTGVFTAQAEHDLEQSFARFTPSGGRPGTELADALEALEATTFIDPVVPVSSQRSGGALVKRAVRSGGLWYVGWITTQVSQFASATSRWSRVVSEELERLAEQLDATTTTPPPAIRFDWAHRADAWWVAEALSAFAHARGPVLHAACADGWLLGRLVEAGVEAYGLDDQGPAVERALEQGLDVRTGRLDAHLRDLREGQLHGVILSGLVETWTAERRDRLVELFLRGLAPSATLVIHSVSPSGWAAVDAPPTADLSPGRPLRATSWSYLLESAGFQVRIHEGTTGGTGDAADYLIVAARGRARHERSRVVAG